MKMKSPHEDSERRPSTAPRQPLPLSLYPASVYAFTAMPCRRVVEKAKSVPLTSPWSVLLDCFVLSPKHGYLAGFDKVKEGKGVVGVVKPATAPSSTTSMSKKTKLAIATTCSSSTSTFF
ncbi:hypothetical protein Fmac_018376 [Flemingia macrophylla]|uniref:Uncharacterized protein n=1 Tax=Flemingia macrophylla TaxID=520843 RepID=A0ABD1M4T2_9FABA